MKAILVFAIAAGSWLTAAANAQNAPQPAIEKPARTQLDPGEILCERVKEIGSRLIVKQVCMTRLQWQEQKAADRVFTEGVQGTLNLRDGG